MSRSARRAMVRRNDPALSLSRQCSILSISRSSLYYRPKGESAESLALMRRIDELYLKYPFYGRVRWPASSAGKAIWSAGTGCGG